MKTILDVREIKERLYNAGNLKDFLMYARELDGFSYADGKGFEFTIQELDGKSEWELFIKFHGTRIACYFAGISINQAYNNLEKSLEKVLNIANGKAHAKAKITGGKNGTKEN